MTMDTPGKGAQAALLLTFSVIGTVTPLLFVTKFVGEEKHGHSHGHATESTSLTRKGSSKASRSGEFAAMILSLGNAFAGGVMLATGLVHILSDSLEMALQVEEDVKTALFQPLVASLCGILIPFFLEKSGLTWWLLQHQACFTDHYTNVHNPSHEESLRDQKGHETEGSYAESRQVVPPMLKANSLPDLLDQMGHEKCTSKCVVPSINATRLQGRLDFHRSVGAKTSLTFAPLIYSLDEELPMIAPSIGEIASPSTAGTVQDQSSESKHHHPPKHSHLNFSTFLMFLVLSIHSLIVGFTIGTIHDVSASQHTAYIAVAIHKIFESMALGTNAAQQPLSMSVYVELSVYNLAAPLGILLGESVQHYNGIDAVSESIILSLASGSFIYIALVEILVDEFENEEYRIAKFLFFASGSIIMAALARAD